LFFSHPRSRHKALSPLPLSDSTGKLAGARVCPDKATITSTQLPGRAPIYASNKFERRKKKKKRKSLSLRLLIWPPQWRKRLNTHTYDIYQQITSSSSYSHWSILPEIRTRLISTVSDGKEQQRRALEKKKRARSSKGTEQANRIGEGK
jgi:hypothetical protein